MCEHLPLKEKVETLLVESKKKYLPIYFAQANSTFVQRCWMSQNNCCGEKPALHASGCGFDSQHRRSPQGLVSHTCNQNTQEVE